MTFVATDLILALRGQLSLSKEALGKEALTEQRSARQRSARWVS